MALLCRAACVAGKIRSFVFVSELLLRLALKLQERAAHLHALEAAVRFNEQTALTKRSRAREPCITRRESSPSVHAKPVLHFGQCKIDK